MAQGSATFRVVGSTLVAAEAGLVLAGLGGRPFADPMAIAVAPSVAGPFLDLLAELHDR